ncbi:MAG: NAD(P)H-hydrate epimerase [Candidatus Hydrogenedentes bacterium]|nr:NAD(P)H-hydrate epimerase [Candidatus Hydrogenedentota bacterium]
MKRLTSSEMREADRRCIQELGIPGAVLMNNAGTAVFRELARGPVGVVCGKGNNGGDGFVVARLAFLAGWDTRVVLIADPAQIQGDAALFMNVYRRLGGAIRVARSALEAADAVVALRDRSVIMDALLGTGIRGDVQEPYRAAIASWPAVHTVAVDLPSGLDADTGEPCGVCVKAAVTVTFQFAKTGLLALSARPYVGRLVVADIGIPESCADDNAWARLKAGWEAPQ